MTPQDTNDLLIGLPAAEKIQQGLHDYHKNLLTIPSCMVRIATPRLAKAGLIAPPAQPDTQAELDLYQLLSHHGDQAYSRYNALIRELISFEHALDHRLSQSLTSL